MYRNYKHRKQQGKINNAFKISQERYKYYDSKQLTELIFRTSLNAAQTRVIQGTQY